MRMRPADAKLGMYVKSFHGSWFSHPFWRGGFLISSEMQLVKIQNGETDFFIDTSKSQFKDRVQYKGGSSSLLVTETARSVMPQSRQVSRMPRAAKRSTQKVLPPRSFGRADKVRAAALAKRSSEIVAKIFNDTRLGHNVPTVEIVKIVGEIVALLESNSSALINVTRLKSKDEYTFTHSVAVCALMINLGRELGMSKDAVEGSGVAGLLHDIGKVHIDPAILKKEAPLTIAERMEVVRHPQLGHEILTSEPGVPAAAIDACLHHHERLDGSGYPYGLRGDSISLVARMTAICDVYDAATSDRPYRRGSAPVTAITEMAGNPEHFDPDILFRFMRSVGVFPVGKLIRLRSNRLGIALPCTRGDALPVVRAFYSTVDTAFIDCIDVVLSDRLTHDQAICSEDPAAWFSDDWTIISAAIVGRAA